MKLAVIGGTGTGNLELFRGWTYTRISTAYGEAIAAEGEISGRPAVFLPRHGPTHSTPPHLINYRANIAALRDMDVQAVIAVCAVGSINPDLRPGTFALLSDFIDFTKTRTCSFYDGGDENVVHTDFTQPYCSMVSGALLSADEKSGLMTRSKCVYLCVEGPRYETPAEIKMFRQWGADVVGMTNVPEVTLAREARLCYGALAAVTNYAAGVSPTPLSHDEVVAAMQSMDSEIVELLRSASAHLDEKRCTVCR
jgi:5'-methylthioadenosine phosphorylase